MTAFQPTYAPISNGQEPLDVGGFQVSFDYETTEYKCFRVCEGGDLTGYLRIVWTGREVFTPHERFLHRRGEIHEAVGEAVATRCFYTPPAEPPLAPTRPRWLLTLAEAERRVELEDALRG
jgi:hypothetical protein